MIVRLALILVALAVLSLAIFAPHLGCHGHGGPESGLRTVQMRIGQKTFTLEVADTPGTREYGLMQRDSMPADHGMIFVFPDEDNRAFWMKNTRIPLDIIYLDHLGRVVSIKQMKPYDLSSVPSDGPTKYAIELNKDAAAGAGVKSGDTLTIPEAARDTKD
jgi:uncharacterized membrane protein (UPF0127 family)